MKNKIENFRKAIERLQDGVSKYKSDTNDELRRDGLIQRYEFTFELAWKTTKAFMENQQLTRYQLPKEVLQSAYRFGFIDNEAVWLEMLKARNMTSHLYDERIAIKTCERVITDYLPELTELLKNIEDRL